LGIGWYYWLFFLIPLFSLPIGKNLFFLWLLIAGFCLNISAALYINNLKKYTITSPQLASATWIKANLPVERTFFSFANNKLLTFYASAHLISIQDPNFYFDKTTAEKIILAYKSKEQTLVPLYQERIVETQILLSQLAKKNSA
jgi:hypothetical protein